MFPAVINYGSTANRITWSRADQSQMPMMLPPSVPAQTQKSDSMRIKQKIRHVTRLNNLLSSAQLRPFEENLAKISSLNRVYSFQTWDIVAVAAVLNSILITIFGRQHVDDARPSSHHRPDGGATAKPSCRATCRLAELPAGDVTLYC